MPKGKCRSCGTLFAGWAMTKKCPLCGGELKSISWLKYYEEKEKMEGGKR